MTRMLIASGRDLSVSAQSAPIRGCSAFSCRWSMTGRATWLSQLAHRAHEVGVELLQIAEGILERLETLLGLVPHERALLGQHPQVGVVLLAALLDQEVVERPRLRIGIQRLLRVPQPRIVGQQRLQGAARPPAKILLELR